MATCTTCGRPLADGAECAVCASSGDTTLVREADFDDWRTDTAERPAIDAAPPGPRTTLDDESGDDDIVRPHASVAEPEVAYRARFPLFADEEPPPRHPEAAPQPDQTPSRLATAPNQLTWERLRPWLIVGFACLLFSVFVLALVMSRSSGDSAEAVGTGRSPSESATTDVGAAAGSPATEPVELAAQATVSVPATAAPNEDVFGNPVSYAASNLQDGDPGTAWRMPGDGTGEVVTIELPGRTTVSEVGLINGYAKTGRLTGGRTRDWYTGNRRIERVQWIFDGGAVVDQDLRSTRRLQTVPVPPTDTDRIQLKLVDVSAPGTGPAARNFTAISEVSVVGVPAG